MNLSSRWNLQQCRVILMVFALFCTFTTSTATPAGDTTSPVMTQVGLRYYLPTDSILVETSRLKSSAALPSADLSKRVSTNKVSYAVSVSVETVADSTAFYLLPSDRPGAFRSATIETKLFPTGILSGINRETVGQTGEILKNVFRFVAVVAPALGVLDADAVPPWPNPVPRCSALDLGGLDLITRFFIKHAQAGCDLWESMQAYDRDLAALEARLRVLRAELSQAPYREIAALMRSVEDVEKLLAATRSERARTEARLRAGRAQFEQAHRLVAKEEEVKASFRFTTQELPLLSVAYPGADLDVLKTKLDGRAKQLLERTGVVVAREGMSTTPLTSGGHCNGSVAKGVTRIYYRQSTPVRLAVLVEKDGKLELHNDRLVDLIDDQSPPGCLEVKTSALARRTLGVEFDGRGRPIRVAESSGSSALALSAGLADGAIAARDAYVDTLSKLASAAESRRTLELDDLTTDIAQIKKEKELIDSQIALQGATSNQESVVMQQQLAAQLALLEAQLKLKQAEAGFDVQLELAQLKLVLERLQQELALLKAQQELAKAATE